MAGLSHPNIVQVYALERVAKRVYFACELVDGQTLAEEIEARGKFTPPETVGVARDVVAALAYAHERGVIHRDVKLQNVMRTRAGVVKLTDFGLAKTLTTDASLTAQGFVVGTILYLAPEILIGAPASAHSDMYALGVMLRMLLAGRTGREAAVARSRRSANPDLAKELRGEGLAEEMVALLARLLDPDPAKRFPDYGALAAALARMESVPAGRLADTIQ